MGVPRLLQNKRQKMLEKERAFLVYRVLRCVVVLFLDVLGVFFKVATDILLISAGWFWGF